MNDDIPSFVKRGTVVSTVGTVRIQRPARSNQRRPRAMRKPIAIILLVIVLAVGVVMAFNHLLSMATTYKAVSLAQVSANPSEYEFMPISVSGALERRSVTYYDDGIGTRLEHLLYLRPKHGKPILVVFDDEKREQRITQKYATKGVVIRGMVHHSTVGVDDFYYINVDSIGLP